MLNSDIGIVGNTVLIFTFLTLDDYAFGTLTLLGIWPVKTRSSAIAGKLCDGLVQCTNCRIIIIIINVCWLTV